MNCKHKRLLIHHHEVARINEEGAICLSAGIGKWVKALSLHFKSIGLLLHESTAPRRKQDYALKENNVHLVSLGPPGKYFDRIQKMQRIKKVCQSVGQNADILLIRGLTPRQMTVWKNTPVPYKAFLLVRDVHQNRLTKLTLLNLFSALVNNIREREYRRITRSKTLLLANSPVYLKDIEALANRKAHFVPTNTMFKKDFPPIEFRPLNASPQLLFVGRINYMKGLRELIQSLKILNDKGVKCNLHIAGTGENAILENLKTLAKKEGLSTQITWHGRVNFGPQLFELYQKADCFVLPTYSEGFPRVFWEAASQSCPVIISAIGGIPAILEDQKHALLIPPKNPDAIAEAIQTLLHPDIRTRLIKAAYHLAEDYALESCADILAKNNVSGMACFVPRLYPNSRY